MTANARIGLLSAGISAILVLSPAYAAPADCMENDPSMWLTTTEQQELRATLMSYFVCPTNAEDGRYATQVACNYFVAKFIQDQFGYSDFVTEEGWMTANEIADEAETNEAWTSIGDANVQASLDRAAQLAGQGKAVIAVKKGSPGHVALILPGEPKRSGSWSLNVPNSASFSLGNVENAFAFCRLSYAFSSSNGVSLFARN